MKSPRGKLIAFFFVAFFGVVTAWAQVQFPGDNNSVTDIYKSLFDDTLWDASHLNAPCNTCSLANTGQMDDSSCQDWYKKMYRKNPTVMNLMFGYMDHRSEGSPPPQDLGTSDRYLAAAMIDKITAYGIDPKTGVDRCPPGRNDCGFTRDPDDMTKFTRQILGPDGQTHMVELHISFSSASDNDDDNTNPGSALAAEQQTLTQSNERRWLNGLAHSDVQIYAGHWRKGGGPDFGPPVLIDGTNRVDYPYYRVSTQKNPNSISQTLSALQNTATPPTQLALFACDADSAIESVRAAARQSGVVMSGLKDTFEGVFYQAAATLDTDLNFRCANSFNTLINSEAKYQPNLISPVQTRGMFSGGSGGYSSAPLSDPMTSTPDADPNQPYMPSPQVQAPVQSYQAPAALPPAVQAPVQSYQAPPVVNSVPPALTPHMLEPTYEPGGGKGPRVGDLY